MISAPAESAPNLHRRIAARTAPLGELLVAVVDEASRYTTDPHEISRITAEVVARILRRAVRLAAR